jgi:hypothetical protein
MGHYGQEKDGSVLDYQLEYLLFGNDIDVVNLKQTVNAICAMREVANTLYLYSDKEKCAIAETVATVIATLLMVPEIIPLLKTTLILGWAFAESMYDVKQILAGKRVPLLKDKTSWHYGIEKVLQFGGVTGNFREGKGLRYEDYLRIMMMLGNPDELTVRAMNLVEADIRLTPGNQYFRLDSCYDRIAFRVRIVSKYGYVYETTKQKGY